MEPGRGQRQSGRPSGRWLTSVEWRRPELAADVMRGSLHPAIGGTSIHHHVAGAEKTGHVFSAETRVMSRRTVVDTSGEPRRPSPGGPLSSGTHHERPCTGEGVYFVGPRSGPTRTTGKLSGPSTRGDRQYAPHTCRVVARDMTPIQERTVPPGCVDQRRRGARRDLDF